MKKILCLIFFVSFILIGCGDNFKKKLNTQSNIVNNESRDIVENIEKVIYHSNQDLCANIKFTPPLDQEIAYNEEIAKDEFVQYLRRAINDYLSSNYISYNDNTCNFSGLLDDKHCEDVAYDDLAEFIDYLDSKFIVLQIDIAPGGGSSLIILFKNKPDKLFYAWVYGHGDGYFDLRGFQEHWSGEIETSIEDIQRIFVNQICSEDVGI